MARIARLVIPSQPHLITQRGNRREPVFFTDADYQLYLRMLSTAVVRAGAQVWAYCLMPTHVHIVLTPQDDRGLQRVFADLHRRYTGTINARNGWTGHLWQGRFGSVAMDQPHLIAAVRYVSLNPVRAALVKRPEDWPWSSARAHCNGRDDDVVTVAPVLDLVGPFGAFLDQIFDDAASFDRLRRAESVGRPVGSGDWIKEIEEQSGRRLAPGRPGPKPRSEAMAGEEDVLGKLSP